MLAWNLWYQHYLIHNVTKTRMFECLPDNESKCGLSWKSVDLPRRPPRSVWQHQQRPAHCNTPSRQSYRKHSTRVLTSAPCSKGLSCDHFETILHLRVIIRSTFITGCMPTGNSKCLLSVTRLWCIWCYTEHSFAYIAYTYVCDNLSGMVNFNSILLISV